MDRETLELARVIHIARLKDCYMKGEPFERAMARQPFPPVDSKEFRELRHHGQSWIDIAITQAKAVQAHTKDANRVPTIPTNELSLFEAPDWERIKELRQKCGEPMTREEFKRHFEGQWTDELLDKGASE